MIDLRKAVEDMLADGIKDGGPGFWRHVSKVRAALDADQPPRQHVGWTKVTPDMPHELLKSINVDNQVLAYERGRYFNAWLIFDEYEGGWCWTDETDSEPNPSHIRPLSEVALATTEGKEG